MHIARPSSLFALFASVSGLPGIGPKLAGIIEKKMGGHIIDLVRHLPVSLIDRRARPSVDSAIEGQIATFDILVLSADIPPARTNRPARILAETKGGQIELVFFHARSDWLKNTLPVGQKRTISGRVERFQGKLQMAHPDYSVPADKADEIPDIEPIYPLSAGLKPRPLRKAINAGLQVVPQLDEWIDSGLLTRQGWPDLKTALTLVHHPQSINDLLI